MELKDKQIFYYRTTSGIEPFKDWFNSLRDKKTQALIDIRIGRVQMGNFGYCRTVGAGIMELKIDWGPGLRIYFGQYSDKIIILLCGGDKSSQKRDIKTAHLYWEDFRRNYENSKKNKNKNK